MRNFFCIIGVLLKQQYRGQITENKNPKKARNSKIIMYVVLGIVFIPMLVMLAVGMFYAGKLVETEFISSGVSFLILICQGLVLLFGIPNLISNVFICKDAERLLVLPVKSVTVFTAKLSVVYINEVITTAVCILALLLPFGIGAGMGAGYFLMLIVALLLIPMLPMLLGSLIAIPISFFILKVGRNGIIKTVFQILLFVGVMALYMYLVFSFTGSMSHSFPEGATEQEISEYFAKLITDLLGNIAAAMKYVLPNYMLAVAMCTTNFLVGLGNFAGSLGLNAALLGLVILVSIPMYKRTLSRQSEGGASSSKKKVNYEYKNKGVMRQLIVTDFKRVVRDNQLGFQSFMGILMLPLMMVFCGFAFGIGGEEGGTSLFDLDIYQALAPLVVFAYMVLLGSSANGLGLYPISRENRAFSLLKTLPVTAGKIVTAKVILATLSICVSYFLTGLIAVFSLHLKWYYALLMTFAMIEYGFGTMCITTRMDLSSPKLGWTNFNQSLKNTKNSFAGLICGLIVGAIVAVVSVGFIIWYIANPAVYITLIMWAAVIAVGALFAFITYKYMTDSAERLFTQIEF